jgi:HSP20 family protein
MTFATENLLTEFFKSWDRPFLEKKGWMQAETKDCNIIIANILGVDEEDIEVILESDVLTIKGETKDEKLDYSMKAKYSLDVRRLIPNTKKITYECKNGLILVKLHKKDKGKKIKIEKE